MSDTTEPSVDAHPSDSKPAALVSSMPDTLWREGPTVKITLPSRGLEKYKSRALVDASAILFLRTSCTCKRGHDRDGPKGHSEGVDIDPSCPHHRREEWSALVGHPLSSIARSIERCEWHAPSAEALEAIGSSAAVGSVCFFGLETHFVREPLGNTFSACRLGLAARELGGMSAVAVVGLSLGDVLLVKGALGYAAIAKRSPPVSSAPILWTLIHAQTV
jgi:hypothetical protein